MAVLVCEVENWLGEVGGLHDTADLDGAFVLDQLANKVQELRGELG